MKSLKPILEVSGKKKIKINSSPSSLMEENFKCQFADIRFLFVFGQTESCSRCLKLPNLTFPSIVATSI